MNAFAAPKYAAEVELFTTLIMDRQKKVGDSQPLSVEKPKPKDVRFDDFERKPDKWQPPWIVEKILQEALTADTVLR